MRAEVVPDERFVLGSAGLLLSGFVVAAPPCCAAFDVVGEVVGLRVVGGPIVVAYFCGGAADVNPTVAAVRQVQALEVVQGVLNGVQ
jgi:hypothetical protein